MPLRLLSITHWTQARRADCLAACAGMVLQYLGRLVKYDRLLRTLRITPEYGAAGSNITLLTKLGVEVAYGQATLESMQGDLAAGHPCIAFVRTGDLPYWDEDVGHAVVVAGMDDDFVYLHDPALNRAPLAVGRGDFGLAWLEAGEYYAVIKRK